jgi:hypothetical protein
MLLIAAMEAAKSDKNPPSGLAAAAKRMEAPSELLCLGDGWVKTLYQKNSKSAKLWYFTPPQGELSYEGFDSVLDLYVPQEAILRYTMPLKDFFLLLGDLVPQTDHPAWRTAIETGAIESGDLSIRFKNYKDIRRLLAINACRVKLAADSYVIATLPVVVTYSLESQSALFYSDAKMVPGKDLPAELADMISNKAPESAPGLVAKKVVKKASSTKTSLSSAKNVAQDLAKAVKKTKPNLAAEDQNEYERKFKKRARGENKADAASA